MVVATLHPERRKRDESKRTETNRMGNLPREMKSFLMIRIKGSEPSPQGVPGTKRP